MQFDFYSKQFFLDEDSAKQSLFIKDNTSKKQCWIKFDKSVEREKYYNENTEHLAEPQKDVDKEIE